MQRKRLIYWLVNNRSIWLILLTILGSFGMHMLATLYSGRYWGTLISVGWAFVWMPVLLSYLCSLIIASTGFRLALRGINYDLNAFQRIFSLIIADIAIVIHSSHYQDMETASWILLVYLFLVIPTQLLMVLLIEIFLLLKKKKERNRSQGK